MRGFGQKVLVKKVRKNYRFEPVFMAKVSDTGACAGPLNLWLAPLKLRGPPLIIKGAALLKRPNFLSFSGESLFGEKLTNFV